MDIAKYREMFLTEAAEHLQNMVSLLVELEAAPEDRNGIAALFREAHSIKGMAATMSYSATAQLAHHLEDQLDNCRSIGQISSTQIDYLLAAVDLLEGLLQDIRQEQPERSVEAFIQGEISSQSLEVLESVSSSEDQDLSGLLIHLRLEETVAAPGPRLLVLLKKLEEFGRLLETIPAEENILQGENSRILEVRLKTDLSQEQIFTRLQKYSELAEIIFPPEQIVEKQRKQQAVTTTVRVGTDLLDRFINLTGELITNRYCLQTAAAERNWSDLHEGLGQLARLVKNLHHQVLQVRMMPLATVTDRLPRTVRDLCRSSGKEVEFVVDGASIELDRAIIEALTDPLIHMVRNAVDHGIEQQGRVRINAWRERDQVLIQISDNGRGIDLEKIRQRALQCGLLSPVQAENIRDYDLYQLICHPGFSTAKEVSETSGRGVGMDVVKTAVERLGGVLMIDSVVGEGSRMTMKLPLSVAIVRMLLIESAGSLLGLPITRVLQTLEVSPAEVRTSGKQLVITLQGELLPLLSLRKILRQPKGQVKKLLSLVVTEVLGRKIGLVVDRLVGQQEVFVQGLPAPFDRLRGNNGGAILGDGRIMFLLDLQPLLEKRRKKEA